VTLNTVKARLTKLWEAYRTTQAWGKNNSEERSGAFDSSLKFRTTLDVLFDIAKPDIEFRLCEEDWNFVKDQRTSRQSTFGMKDTNLLARIERKRKR